MPKYMATGYLLIPIEPRKFDAKDLLDAVSKVNKEFNVLATRAATHIGNSGLISSEVQYANISSVTTGVRESS